MRVVLLVTLLAPQLAWCDPFEDCDRAATGQQATVACYAAAFTETDRELEQFVVKVADELEVQFRGEGRPAKSVSKLKERLLLSQKSWRQYRESWCKFVADSMDGSGGAQAFVRCEIELTRQRHEEIEEWR